MGYRAVSSKKTVTIAMLTAAGIQDRKATHINLDFSKPGRAETICGLDTILFSCELNYGDPVDCPACLKMWRRCREISPKIVEKGE